MSAQRRGPRLGGALFILSLSFVSACHCCPGDRNKILARRPISKQPVSSTRFSSDGTHVIPVKLQNTPAEWIYEGLIGGYSLSRLSENELYVVFRDRRRNVDTVYKLNNISGEIVYYFNDDRMSRKYTFDHQLILDITDTGSWTMDIYSRDL